MMTPEQSRRSSGAAVGYVIAIVLFAVAGVVAKLSIPAPAIDADPAAARYKALADMQAVEDKSLYTAQVIDSQRGIVRLPIDTATDIAAKNWSSAAAARADLAARVEKSTVAVKPVSFE